MARDFFFELKPVDRWQPNDANSIGGTPWLPVELEWPLCKQCQERLTFLFQFTIDESFAVPFRPGSHFLTFACWQHDDIADLRNSKLPNEFWNTGSRHYQMILARPEDEKKFLEKEQRVKPRRIEFSRRSESIKQHFEEGYDIGVERPKAGGVPCWLQDPETYTCGCGAPMTYFAMLPENFEFPTAAGAPMQPNGGDDHYLLFLGNANYFLACSAQCSPFAVLTVMQN